MAGGDGGGEAANGRGVRIPLVARGAQDQRGGLAAAPQARLEVGAGLGFALADAQALDLAVGDHKRSAIAATELERVRAGDRAEAAAGETEAAQAAGAGDGELDGRDAARRDCGETPAHHSSSTLPIRSPSRWNRASRRSPSPGSQPPPGPRVP